VQLTRRSLRPLLDALCLLAAFVLALLVRFRFETSTIDVQWYWVSLGLFAGVDIGYLYLRGMYDNGHVTADRTAVVVDGLVYATFLYLLIAYLVKNTLFSRLTLAYFLVLSLILQVELERAVVAIRRHRYAHGLDLVPTIVVGAVEDLAAAGLDAPGLQRGLGMQLLHTEAGTVAVKSFGQLEAVLGGGAARAVLLASSLPDISQIVELCLRQYVTVYALGGTVRTLPYPSDVLFVNHTPLLRVRDLLIVGVGARVKRLMDTVLAGLGVLVFSPLLLVLAVLVKLTSRGPVLFGHRRLGEGGTPIRVYKFRSMVVDAEVRLQEVLAADPSLRAEYEATYKLKQDPRVTRLGRWLRRTSMDELPQLFNVLRGDLSLVGPRPIVADEIAKYGSASAVILRVRPGVTGLWQVSGRSDVDYGERVRLDMEYITHWSLWLDLRILAATLPAVLRRKGAR
jgi:exopolysaccharide biosynthesis polyprenyl glycosylphosphotransferase